MMKTRTREANVIVGEKRRVALAELRAQTEG